MKTFFSFTFISLTAFASAQNINQDSLKPKIHEGICNSSIDSHVIANTSKKCDYKVYYYSNGHKKEEGCLINGKKEGTWKEYSEIDEIQRFEWIYVNGEKNGAYMSFFKSGKINAKGFYKSGSLSDTLTIFSEKGEIVSISVWESFGYKKSRKKFVKIFADNAKPDGTIEFIDGKKYYWQLGEKLELKNN